MRKQRLKIIPDRVFHKLWDNVDKYDTQDGYINNVISCEKIFAFKKYGMDYAEASLALAHIYDLKRMSFKEIIEKAGTRKSIVSHIFCIPIRTVEDWYSGINGSPPYIRLMILKYFHLLNLGKHIRLESDINFFKTQPAVYVKHKKHNKKNTTEKFSSDNEDPKEERTTESYYKQFMMSEDYDDYLDRLIAEVKGKR